jgi:hypothetical protein
MNSHSVCLLQERIYSITSSGSLKSKGRIFVQRTSGKKYVNHKEFSLSSYIFEMGLKEKKEEHFKKWFGSEGRFRQEKIFRKQIIQKKCFSNKNSKALKKRFLDITFFRCT